MTLEDEDSQLTPSGLALGTRFALAVHHRHVRPLATGTFQIVGSSTHFDRMSTTQTRWSTTDALNKLIVPVGHTLLASVRWMYWISASIRGQLKTQIGRGSARGRVDQMNYQSIWRSKSSVMVRMRVVVRGCARWNALGPCKTGTLVVTKHHGQSQHGGGNLQHGPRERTMGVQKTQKKNNVSSNDECLGERLVFD